MRPSIPIREGRIRLPTRPPATKHSPASQAAAYGTADESRAAGRELRDAVPFDAHADWQPAPARPDPVERVLANNAGRQERLIPLRMACTSRADALAGGLTDNHFAG